MGTYAVIFSFTRRNHLPAFVIASILAALAGIIPPATSILVGKLMNAFSQFDAGTVDSETLEDDTQPFVLALVILGTAASGIRALFYAAWIVNGEQQAKAIREELFSSLVKRDYAWFENQTSGVGSLLGRLQVQIREFQFGLSQPLGMVILTISQTVASLTVALYYSWKLTLVLLAGFPLIALTLSFLNRGLQNAVEDQHRELACAANQATHITNNVTLLKCYNGLSKEIQRYEHTLHLVLGHYHKQVLKAASQIAFMRMAAIGLIVIALSFGSYLVHQAGANAGTVLSTFWCCGTASKGFSDILAQSLVLEKGRASALALKSLIRLVDKGRTLSLENHVYTPETLLGQIDFHDVNFAYPSNPDRVILNQLNLSFHHGQTTFVVGSSGSGKSTISYLILKLYAPDQGHIKIDGKSLDVLDTNWLRNNITVVQQDSILFNETLFKNIALGHHDRDEVKERQIYEATNFAMLHETIESLPDGIATNVGSGGCKLSGGQRQRVALARARLRDTPILVLDECTSALDHTARIRLLENIRTWRKNKSTVIITHDLSQIEPFDFTYVLRDGAVVARGSRADLECLEEWPADDKGATISAAFFARHEYLPRSIPAENIPCHRPDSPIEPLQENDTHDPFNECVGLLQYGHVRQCSMKGDRGKSFGALLRSAEYPPSQQPAQSSHDASQQLEDFIHQSEYEMGKLTKSRRLRDRLTMAQAARPYSAYSSFTTRPSDSEIERHSIMLHGVIDPLPGNTDIGDPTGYHISETVINTPVLVKQSFLGISLTIWPSLSAADRPWLMGAFLMSIVYGAVPSAVSWITVRLFQTLDQVSGWKEESRTWSLILLAVAIMEAAAAFYIHFVFELLAQKWINVLRLSALRTVSNNPKSWFDEESCHLSEICSTLDRGAEEMRNIFGRFLPFMLIVVIMITISLILCLVKCWKLTLLGVGCIPFIFVVTKIFQMTSVLWESRTTNSVNNISEVFAESFRDIRTVRALTLESYFHQRFMTANLQASIIGMKRAAAIGLCFGISESLVPFIVAVVFKYSIIVARSPEFPPENILVVLSSMIFTMLGASSILAFIPQISSSVESGSRLLQLARTDPHTERNGELRLEKDHFRGIIELYNVTFVYPTRPNVPIMKCVNLTLLDGEVTAIVGKSGSGKSTMLSLILGLYSLDRTGSEGSLKISGYDITEFDMSNLRSFLAYVPQQPVILPMSIRDNILYGVDEASLLTDDRLHSAAKAAGIHNFVISLPGAYDTIVGDGGTNVSGGQAQRIAIARALAKRPKILLMDEPTSALDVESAAFIRDILRMSSNEAGLDGITTVVVTHSEEMMRLADSVVVFEEGKVVEQGSYEALMANGSGLRQLLSSG